MKSTITIQDGHISVNFTPETDLERLSLAELGDDVSVSRAHQSIVLKPRRASILKISDRIPETESNTSR
ncbi:MAG: hypothetical protein R3E82_15455 [Pseudomonadales bacterium]|nr:hypothetical protein [Pseudomonadales bacterium]